MTGLLGALAFVALATVVRYFVYGGLRRATRRGGRRW